MSLALSVWGIQILMCHFEQEVKGLKSVASKNDEAKSVFCSLEQFLYFEGKILKPQNTLGNEYLEVDRYQRVI